MPSENTGHELTALSHPTISGLLQGTSHRSVGSCRVYGVLWGPRASHGPADAHGSHDVGSVSSAAFLPLVCQLGIKLWWGGDMGHGPGVEAAAVG